MLLKTQIEPDTPDPDHALVLVRISSSNEDIINAGISLIKSIGIGIYSRLKDPYPDKNILGNVSIYRNLIGCGISSQTDIAQAAKIIAQRIHESRLA